MKATITFWTVLALAAGAATPAAAADDLTADEVIRRYIEATGGYDNLKAVESMRLTGSYVAGTQPIESVWLRKRPNLYRWDRDLGEKDLVLSYDGEMAWWINPFGSGSPEEMNREDSQNLRGEARFDDPLIDYRAKGHRVELLGTDDVDGRMAYKLKVTLDDGSVERFFLDADTFLKIQHSLVFTAINREHELRTYYMNYKAVDGILLPYRIEREFAGQHRVLEFETIELNPQLDDAVFALPGG